MDDVMLVDSGIQILVDNLGIAETERFFNMLNRERFDYTKWHGVLSEGRSVREIHEAAAKRWEQNQKNEATESSSSEEPFDDTK